MPAENAGDYQGYVRKKVPDKTKFILFSAKQNLKADMACPDRENKELTGWRAVLTAASICRSMEMFDVID